MMAELWFILVTSLFGLVAGQTCPPGQERVATICTNCLPGNYKESPMTSCEPCPIGYYQPTPGQATCIMCQQIFITATIGSTHVGQCSIANCAVGYYRDLRLNTCQICPIGTYQATKWKDGGCTQCGGARTTVSTGSTSFSQCLVSCPAGKEDRGNANCEHCLIGFYKSTPGPTRCVGCPTGTLTSGTGATSSTQCSLETCYPGEYRNTVTSACQKCPVGSYQAAQDQTTCQACPVVGGVQLSTLQDGSTNVNQCLQNCPSGEEHSSTTGLCVLCPQGEYRTAGVQGQCVACPSGKTTSGTGSTGATDCNVEICPSGRELSATGVCEVCPQGEYRTSGVQAECTLCPTDYTTASTAAEDVSECNIAACLAGSMRVSNTCQLCPKNTYQPDKWKTTCIGCPTGTVTLAMGSTAYAACVTPGTTSSACSTNPCLNGGSCSITTGVAVCICTSGYQGNLCQTSSSGGATPTPAPGAGGVNNAAVTTTASTITTTANATAVALNKEKWLPYILGGSVAGVVLIVAAIIIGAIFCNYRNSHPYGDGKSDVFTDYSRSSRDISDMYSGPPVSNHVYRTGHVTPRQSHLPREGENRLPISDYPQAGYRQAAYAQPAIAYTQPRTQPQPAIDYNAYNWRQSQPRAAPAAPLQGYATNGQVVQARKSETSSEFLFYEETPTGAKIGKGLEGYDLNVS